MTKVTPNDLPEGLIRLLAETFVSEARKELGWDTNPSNSLINAYAVGNMTAFLTLLGCAIGSEITKIVPPL